MKASHSLQRIASIFLLLLWGQPAATQTNGDTCTISMPDGSTQIFANGDLLPIPTRCKLNPTEDVTEYQCTCNPDVPNQIECPYCRVVDQNSDLNCIKGELSLSFVNGQGSNQVCSCTVIPGEEPTLSCIMPSNAVDSCVRTDPITGEDVVFNRGAPFGALVETSCGTAAEYPCFCNPDMERGLDCPYCGFARSDGRIFCAADDASVTFQDNNLQRTCSCQIPDDPTAEQIKECSTEFLPTPPPTSFVEGCPIQNANGESVLIPVFDSFGSLYNEGVCKDTTNFPAFCDVLMSEVQSSQETGITRNDVLYPYCIFSNTQDGNVVCAKNGQTVSFVGTDGVQNECSCQYANVNTGAQTNCETETITQMPISTSNAPVQSPVDTTATPVASTTAPVTAPSDATAAPTGPTEIQATDQNTGGSAANAVLTSSLLSLLWTVLMAI